MRYRVAFIVLSLLLVVAVSALVLTLFTTSPASSPAPWPKPLALTNPEPLKTHALALLSIYRARDGELTILASKNADQSLPIASITKLITALTALKDYPDDRSITIARADLLMNSDPAFLRPGDRFTVRSLLYPLLVESSNNAAEALARRQDEKSFVAEMNQTAAAAGMSSSRFYNPSGLDPVDNGGGGINVASAYDLARLGNFILDQHPELLEITTLEGYQLFTADGQFHHELVNTDYLLNDQTWPADIVGGKTGTTDLARKTLLFILRDRTSGGYLINVVLGTDDNFRDMKSLIDWVYRSYKFS